jgi:hypothetical protein
METLDGILGNILMISCMIKLNAYKLASLITNIQIFNLIILLLCQIFATHLSEIAIDG